MIRERTDDPAELEIYGRKAPLARAGHAITPLAFYGALEVQERPPMEGVVIQSFPSVKAARAWYDSPAHQAARPHRQRGADYRVFIVEGIAAQVPATLATRQSSGSRHSQARPVTRVNDDRPRRHNPSLRRKGDRTC